MGTKTLPAKISTKSQLEQFAEFLLRKEILSTESLKEVFMLQAEWDKRIGQLALLKGYIKPQDVFSTMTTQMESHRRFGEVAATESRMGKKELKELLTLQKSHFRLFLEALVHSRQIKKTVLKTALKEFLDASKDPARIQETGGKVYQVPMELLKKPNSRITPEEMKEKLKEIKELSALPEVVQHVLGLLANRDTELKEIAVVVETDVGLAASMLRMVNSASMAMRTQVESIEKAVVILGFEGVRRCVLAASVLEKFKHAGSVDCRAAWTHAVLTGEWARLLIKQVLGAGDEAEDAFTGGLLHDLGKLAIWEYYPQIARNIQNAIDRGLPPLEAERLEMGMSHPEIGGFLCHFWGFPEALGEAVAYHHAGPVFLRNLKEALPLTHVVNASCRLANLGYDMGSEEGTVCINFSALDKEFVRFHGLDLDFIASQADGVY
ncbi:MAG: HDOD domain-containing protein, partial [Planctomycetota bacterium]